MLRDLLARNGVDGHLQRELLAGVGSGLDRDRGGLDVAGGDPAGWSPSPEIVWVPPVSSKLTPTSVSSESPWFCTWTSSSGGPAAADRRRRCLDRGSRRPAERWFGRAPGRGCRRPPACRRRPAPGPRRPRADRASAMSARKTLSGTSSADALVLELGVDRHCATAHRGRRWRGSSSCSRRSSSRPRCSPRCPARWRSGRRSR